MTQTQTQQWAAVFRQAAVGIALTDPQGRFIEVNRGVCNMFGYSAEELLHRSYRDCTHPDDRAVCDAQANRLISGAAEDFQMEKRYIRKNGSILWANVNCSAVREGGKMTGLLAVIMDITARKRLEEQIQSLNSTLEQRVIERTAEVERQVTRLRTLAVQLTHAEQTERRRVASVIHDHLQQLLVAARMQLASLRRKPGGPEAQEAARHVDEMILQAIEVGRSLTVELSPPVLRDAGLAAALAWLARRMESLCGLTVHLDCRAKSEPDSEDVRTTIFQAVQELLQNVSKHAGVKEVRVVMDNTPQGLLRLVVEDHGAGFDAENLWREPGSLGGIGLFNHQQRLESFGATMAVESRPGKGTVVTLTAPVSLYARTREAPAQPPLPYSPASAPTREDGRIRVLLADDHEILREGLAELLRTEPDIEVVGEAADGQIAIELARRTAPDVIVMDVTMPRLNGVEATRRITAEMPHVRVIGLSMHSREDMSRAMREAGAAAYLTKGGPSDLLLTAIRACGPRRAVVTAN